MCTKYYCSYIGVEVDCPEPLIKSHFCYNGGQCRAEIIDEEEFVPYCACAPGYHGERCERMYDDGLYAFLMGNSESEVAAISALIVFVLVGILIISFMLYYYRRLRRNRVYTPSTMEMSRGMDSIPRVESSRRFARFQHHVSKRYPTYYVSPSEFISPKSQLTLNSTRVAIIEDETSEHPAKAAHRNEACSPSTSSIVERPKPAQEIEEESFCRIEIV